MRIVTNLHEAVEQVEQLAQFAIVQHSSLAAASDSQVAGVAPVAHVVTLQVPEAVHEITSAIRHWLAATAQQVRLV